MSFLNPVNEPVLRFKSTDAGAPQINYNARVAGDVKAVLKACLVTGYGATASAGWSVVNEVGHVAEFVSPSAAMSDYRLGVDDTSASSTTWYYQYQDARINPASNTPTKSITQADKTSISNGWTMLVTDRGFVLLESFMHIRANKLSTRVTYFGQNKSAINVAAGQNICFFSEGHNGGGNIYDVYNITRHHVKIGAQVVIGYASSVPFSKRAPSTYTFDLANADITAELYFCNSEGVLLGQQVGMLGVQVNKEADLYGMEDKTIGGRPVVKICMGYDNSFAEYVYTRAKVFLFYADYWEY